MRPNAHLLSQRHILGLEYARNPIHQQRVFGAIATIQQALAQRKRPYIAFSGGKDSMIVLALVQQIAGAVPAVWSDDELEYPELVQMMSPLIGQPDLIVTYGEAEHAGWYRPWRTRPYWRDPFPGTIRIGMDVDEWMATRGHDLVFTGLRAEENARRRAWLEAHGPIYRVRSGVGLRCCPIWDWTIDDVWAYTAAQGLPVCGVYDRMEEIGIAPRAQRVGPLPLARRTHLEQGWPELYDRLVARYGARWS